MLHKDFVYYDKVDPPKEIWHLPEGCSSYGMRKLYLTAIFQKNGGDQTFFAVDEYNRNYYFGHSDFSKTQTEEWLRHDNLKEAIQSIMRGQK